MNDNILTFPGAKTPVQIEEDKAQAIAEQQVRISAAQDDARVKQLAELDKIRDLINRGELEGFILIARSPRNVFLTEVALPGAASPTELMAYLGAIECVKLELTETCQVLPQMINDGTIVAAREVADQLL